MTSAAAEFSQGCLDHPAHLRRELGWLDLRLRLEITLARRERGTAGRYDEFAGLVISDDEIDRYFNAADDTPDPAADVVELQQRIRAEAAEIGEARARATAAGQLLRLSHLREVFDLVEPEYLALLACLAPELDLRFERYFAYLQNDVAKKRPSLQLLAKLFFAGSDPYPLPRRLLPGEDSLLGLGLLEPVKEADGGLAGRELRSTEGVLHFVLANDGPDPELRGLGRWRVGQALPQEPRYFQQHGGHLQRLASLAERDGRLPFTFLRGPEGCGKEDLVLGLAALASGAVLECPADDLLAFAGDFAAWLRVMERDLRLHAAFLWIRHADALRGAAASDGQRVRLRALGSFLAAHPSINVVFSGARTGAELGAELGLRLLELELRAPDVRERTELWQTAIAAQGDSVIQAGDATLAESLAAKFKFGPGGISGALQRLAWESGSTGADGDIAPALHRACRLESSCGLESHALRLRPKYRWNDLVLPPDLLAQLREIRNAVRHRARVHGAWGFEHKFSLGKGLNVLFSGASGTGKTMSAEVLAGDLELDLYRIDLASVVSKYIGETEKNLGRIFQEAESANCILLFDEADALFGKRSEVKDAHDRYANIEINYLLQRMEDYEGIVILTTNMLKNLDAAFTRRIQYTIEFPLPDERQREQLWAAVFPADTPKGGDLDLDYLARRFKLSGANIKNVALNSAFLAAANGGQVDMGHVVTALEREYRKLGKLISRSEFGAYGHLLHDEARASES
jgi:hypothetical protein